MGTQSRPMTVRAGVVALVAVGILGLAGLVWFADRYDDRPRQAVDLTVFAEDAYPENPELISQAFGKYPHRQLIIQQLGDSRFRLLLQPAAPQAAAVDLTDIDLAHFVAAVPAYTKADADLTRVGLIDREWNRQQVRFARHSPHVHVRKGGDGFEQRALSRIDLARNCLNAGLWEVILFTTEAGEERVYEHLWFTFPLGLYKMLFERVNGLSYWSHWWSLEHWTDPSGTRIPMDRIRTVERQWPVHAKPGWDEPVAMQGEQARKQKNILTPIPETYRDWYSRPVRFASFIPPGRYSRAHLRDTELHYLADLAGATLRQVTVVENPRPLLEIDLAFRSSKTGEATRLILGGLDGSAIPVLPSAHYDRGWQVPLGIGNPGFFESYEQLAAHPPVERSFYGFHLDREDRWLNHHAIGVDGPLLHWDADNPSLLHLYLLSYERHALLNHIVLTMPPDLVNPSARIH